MDLPNKQEKGRLKKVMDDLKDDLKELNGWRRMQWTGKDVE